MKKDEKKELSKLLSDCEVEVSSSAKTSALFLNLFINHS